MQFTPGLQFDITEGIGREQLSILTAAADDGTYQGDVFGMSHDIVRSDEVWRGPEFTTTHRVPVFSEINPSMLKYQDVPPYLWTIVRGLTSAMVDHENLSGDARGRVKRPNDEELHMDLDIAWTGLRGCPDTHSEAVLHETPNSLRLILARDSGRLALDYARARNYSLIRSP